MISPEVQDLYWRILRERIASNELAREVFSADAVQPGSLRSAEALYRCVVWNLWHQAREEAWPTPAPAKIAVGAPPYFTLRRDGECVLIEPTGGAR